MELNYIQEYLNKNLTTSIYGNFVHIWINLIQDLQKKHAIISIFSRSQQSPPLFFSKILWSFFLDPSFSFQQLESPLQIFQLLFRTHGRFGHRTCYRAGSCQFCRIGYG